MEKMQDCCNELSCKSALCIFMWCECGFVDWIIFFQYFALENSAFEDSVARKSQPWHRRGTGRVRISRRHQRAARFQVHKACTPVGRWRQSSWISTKHCWPWHGSIFTTPNTMNNTVYSQTGSKRRKLSGCKANDLNFMSWCSLLESKYQNSCQDLPGHWHGSL